MDGSKQGIFTLYKSDLTINTTYELKIDKLFSMIIKISDRAKLYNDPSIQLALNNIIGELIAVNINDSKHDLVKLHL